MEITEDRKEEIQFGEMVVYNQNNNISYSYESDDQNMDEINREQEESFEEEEELEPSILDKMDFVRPQDVKHLTKEQLFTHYEELLYKTGWIMMTMESIEYEIEGFENKGYQSRNEMLINIQKYVKSWKAPKKQT